jgi:uncharacterized membrane protein YdbT with pleckstrin-like domain
MSISRQLQPDEQVLYRAHPSRVVLLPLLTLGAVLVLGGFALRGFTGNDWALYVPAALGGVALLLAGARHLALNANEYVLTDRRVLRQTGLLAKSSMDIYLDKINNVEHRQTLWGRLLNFGDVEIDTASQVGEAVFPRISRPLDFKRAIVGAAEAYRSGRRPVAAAAAAPAAAPVASAAPAAGAADKLRELKRLLDDGLISPAEFEAKRKQLVDQL